jgi:hypothetical protein
MVRKAVQILKSEEAAQESERPNAREAFLKNREFFQRQILDLANAVK